jgi:tRNA(adenine34) deaminase
MCDALQLAKTAAQIGEIPVGAVVVDERSCAVIAAAHNKTVLAKDFTAHAEILALRAASNKINSAYLDHCVLYTTLEPCVMCAGAIALCRIRRLYIGAEDAKYGAIINGPRLYDKEHSGLCFVPEYYSGIMEADCREILQDFFLKLRTK